MPLQPLNAISEKRNKINNCILTALTMTSDIDKRHGSIFVSSAFSELSHKLFYLLKIGQRPQFLMRSRRVSAITLLRRIDIQKHWSFDQVNACIASYKAFARTLGWIR